MPRTNERRRFLYHNNPEYRQRSKMRQKRWYLERGGKENVQRRRISGYFSNYYRKIKEEFPWRIALQRIRARCGNINRSYGKRGIKCLITEKELKILWFMDKAMDMSRPSIDRINSRGHYVFSNCRFIELLENLRRNSGPKSIMSNDVFQVIKNIKNNFNARDIYKVVIGDKKAISQAILRLKKSGFIKLVNKPKHARDHIYKYEEQEFCH